MPEPCMCGDPACPSCGRAQGYEVKIGPRGYYNPFRCQECGEEISEEEGEVCEACLADKEG